MQAQPPLISDLSMTCLQLAPVLLVLKLDLPFISLSSGLDLLCFLVVIVHFVNFLPPLPMPSSSLRLNTVQFDGDAIASDSLGMKRCEHPIRRIADKLIAMIFLFFLFFCSFYSKFWTIYGSVLLFWSPSPCPLRFSLLKPKSQGLPDLKLEVWIQGNLESPVKICWTLMQIWHRFQQVFKASAEQAATDCKWKRPTTWVQNSDGRVWNLKDP